jgi:hypothetical protein
MIRKQPSGLILAISCALIQLMAARSGYSHEDLSGPVWTNGQFQFTLNYWNGITFAIESSPDLVNWTPIFTNTDSSDQLLITLDAPDDSMFYRAVAFLPPIEFSYALGAVGSIAMNGNGLVSDSFNSADTNLSTNGQYDPAKASTNGNVASVQGIVNIGNHTIFGNLYLGPTATCTNNPDQITGTIYTNYNVRFPDVTLPNTDTNGNQIEWLAAAPIVGSGGIYTNYFTSNGYYDINNNYPIFVQTNVSVTVDVKSSSYSPGGLTINGGTTNSGTLVMYQKSGTVTLGGNSGGGAIHNRPQNFIYFGLPGVSSITLSIGTNFVGVIYAPEASLTLNGGGDINNFEGSAIIQTVALNGHYTFHFDESLLTLGPF